MDQYNRTQIKVTSLLKKNKNKDSRGIAAEKGVIIAHYGIAVGVLFASGERRKIKVKRQAGHVVGDNVVLEGHHIKGMPRKPPWPAGTPAGA